MVHLRVKSCNGEVKMAVIIFFVVIEMLFLVFASETVIFVRFTLLQL